MKQSEILLTLKNYFAEEDLNWVEAEAGDSYLFASLNKINEVIAFLKTTESLAFDYLVNLSAFDGAEHIEVTYHLYSYTHRHSFVVKVKVPRLNGEVPTVTDLYGTANFQEREVYDHFGVKFTGHPDLRRILLPDDWQGHPLLKDYKEEAMYNGVETTRPPLL